MEELRIRKPLILPPIVITKRIWKDVFNHCAQNITQEGNAAFIQKMTGYTYPHFQYLSHPFQAGELYQRSADDVDYPHMVLSYVDDSHKIQIMGLDNNPELPPSTRGQDLLILTSGIFGYPSSFALLTKRQDIIAMFEKAFRGKKQRVDDSVFAPPVMYPYELAERKIAHIAKGHVEGKTCQSCSRPGHEKDTLVVHNFDHD